MDKTEQAELVDLGDAKDLTKGPMLLTLEEDHPVLIYRPMD